MFIRRPLEELVLAAEDLAHAVVGEDPADRVGQEIRARENPDVVGRPGAPDNIRVLSCANLLTDSIRRIFTDDSVSEVFGGENQLF